MKQEFATDVNKEVAKAIVAGLKQAGVDFIAGLCCTRFGHLMRDLKDDPAFNYVPVADEHDAIGICVGASLAGKKPAFIAQNAGLIMATYALNDSLHYLGGVPMLLLADHSGGFGDGAGYFFLGYGLQQTRILDSLQILYKVVNHDDLQNIPNAIVNAQRSATTNRKPAAILLSGEGR